MKGQVSFPYSCTGVKAMIMLQPSGCGSSGRTNAGSASAVYCYTCACAVARRLASSS